MRQTRWKKVLAKLEHERRFYSNLLQATHVCVYSSTNVTGFRCRDHTRATLQDTYVICEWSVFSLQTNATGFILQRSHQDHFANTYVICEWSVFSLARRRHGLSRSKLLMMPVSEPIPYLWYHIVIKHHIPQETLVQKNIVSKRKLPPPHPHPPTNSTDPASSAPSSSVPPPEPAASAKPPQPASSASSASSACYPSASSGCR